MTRRNYGSGSLYQRSDGMWIGTSEVGWTSKGTRRRITVSSKDKAKAKAKLRDKIRQIEAEGHAATGGARVTIKQYAEDWLERRKTQVRAKPWSTDAGAVRKWIIPTIGHRRLSELTPADIRAVGAAQVKAGRSTSTRRRTHATLTGLLKAALLDGHQVPPRVMHVEAPRIGTSDRDAMPPADLEAVLTIAQQTLPHWSRWLAQALYGQRPAELLGLTEEDLDFERKIIIIRWQLQRLPYLDRSNPAAGFVVPDGMRARHLEAAWHLTPPKTKRGERIAPMLPFVERALRDWLPQREANPHGLVWPRPDGQPRRERADQLEWYALQDAAGVAHPSGRPFYIYEARHAFATRLKEAGVDDHTITALMGHSSITTSRGYMHTDQTAALAALERASGMLALNPPNDA